VSPALARLAVGIAALAAVAACTTAPNGGGEPPIGAVVAVRTDADIALPLDTVIPTAEQQHIVMRALSVLGQACMRRFGLDWPVEPPTAPVTGPRHERRYTILDAAKARAEGYHAIDLINQERAALARAAGNHPSTAARNIWTGGGSVADGRLIPSGGCAGEATRTLHTGIKPVDTSVPQKLQRQSFDLMLADSRVGRSFARWSTCMKGKGFGYPDPIAAFGDGRWQVAAISRTEIDTATADVDCKVAVDVGGVMLAVETAYQQRMMEQHRTEIAAAKAYFDAELVSARRILAA
jgi:hypothetical protein